MKTSALLITVVVMLHCAALGALFFIQGCGTTARTGTPPPATLPTMPPTTKEAVTYPPPKPVEKAPAIKAVTKEAAKVTETTEYVVKAGDSIGGIAKRFGISRSEIAELNKMSDPNKLRVGQKLVLPGSVKIKAAPTKHSAKAKAVETPAAAAAPAEMAAPAAAAPAPAGAVSAVAPAPGKEYVVQKGDMLSRIAKKCGVKVSALREANNLKSDKLKVGQKLVIPEASSAPVAPVAPVAPAATEAPAASAAPSAVAVPVAKPVPSVESVPPATPAPAPAPATPAAPAASAAPAAPAAPAASAVPAAPAAPAKPVANSGITHIVQPSEDLNSVAKLYAVTVDEVVELNQLGSNRTVKVGQRLKIP